MSEVTHVEAELAQEAIQRIFKIQGTHRPRVVQSGSPYKHRTPPEISRNPCPRKTMDSAVLEDVVEPVHIIL